MAVRVVVPPVRVALPRRLGRELLEFALRDELRGAAVPGCFSSIRPPSRPRSNDPASAPARRSPASWPRRRLPVAAAASSGRGGAARFGPSAGGAARPVWRRATATTAATAPRDPVRRHAAARPDAADAPKARPPPYRPLREKKNQRSKQEETRVPCGDASNVDVLVYLQCGSRVASYAGMDPASGARDQPFSSRTVFWAAATRCEAGSSLGPQDEPSLVVPETLTPAPRSASSRSASRFAARSSARASSSRARAATPIGGVFHVASRRSAVPGRSGSQPGCAERRAEPGRAEPGRAEPGRAEPGRPPEAGRGCGAMG